MELQEKNPAFDILIEGAQTLVEDMKTPAEMLYFINCVLRWIYEIDDPENKFYTFSYFIDDVIRPWFAGGPDMINNVAIGLKEIYEMGGCQGFNKAVEHLFFALSNYVKSCTPTDEHWQEISNGISSLLHLDNCFSEYYFKCKETNSRELAGQ